MGEGITALWLAGRAAWPVLRDYLPSLVCALLFWVLPALFWRRVARAFFYLDGDDVTDCDSPKP